MMKIARLGFALLASVLFLLVCACSTEAVIQEVLGKSLEAPVFIDCRPVSSTEIAFTFSRPVRVVSLNFDIDIETDSIEEGEEVIITLSRPLEAGRKITADILVEDSGRNSLNVIVPFRSRNDRMPAIIFNEIRTEYTKSKPEYVEFFVLGSGNLGAMKFFIAGYSQNPVYEFPPAEVSAGEYIVLHLRTMDEECKDETGQDLALSGGNDAQSNARDLWVPGAVKLIHKTDALWLADQDGKIIDAVLLCEKPDAGWGKSTAIPAAAEMLGRENAWLPPAGAVSGEDGNLPASWIPGPDDAVFSGTTTNTRTICRDETIPPGPRAKNWYVTVTSGATPGKANNVKRYN